MRIEVHIYHHHGEFQEILREVKKMSQEFETLRQEVAQSKTVMASAAVLIRGFNQKLKDAIAAGGQPADFQQLSNELDGSEQDLAAAVAEGTAAQNEGQPPA